MRNIAHEEDIRTVHLFVVPEQAYEEYRAVPIRRIINGILCCIFAALLLALPSDMSVAPWEIKIPLQFLTPQQLTATIAIQPTGKNVIPATNANGWLTVYNGSILVQQLPKGFIVTSQSGVEIMTDETAIIPAGNPPAYGMVKVPAHAVSTGRTGNIAALSVNETYGTSLYLKNLAVFSGGADSRTVTFVTDTDKQAALSSARYRLNIQAKRDPAMLIGPCGESLNVRSLELMVLWSCQFARYIVSAGLHVHSVQRDGDSVRLEVSR